MRKCLILLIFFIFILLSYNFCSKNNENLTNVLSKLYLSITMHRTPNSKNRLIAFTQQEKEISILLHYISMNPNDENSCKALNRIVNKIGY
ncbi:hypothetical protein [Clostridium hydrogenum]|uniref:hypothetical protein n=1 Tax=Clostridium hydrogenum TaxID=2855764 RepID=UPI001F442560|nr:hypothetical protein [Clostridium hydrogenum]